MWFPHLHFIPTILQEADWSTVTSELHGQVEIHTRVFSVHPVLFIYYTPPAVLHSVFISAC